MTKSIGSDFWWLSPQEVILYRFTELFHQEPYSDEPNTDKDPLSCPMQQSDDRYPLESIEEWKGKFRNTNVFRSYELYDSDIEGQKIIGPLIIDIDRIIERNGGYLPDFDKALKDTRRLIKEYFINLKSRDYRIFFTGHKGFHIEISPSAIGVSSNTNRWHFFEKVRVEINKRFGSAFIDKFHLHVRLHNSINSWIDYYGKRVDYMNYEVSIDELFNLQAADIVKKARNLVAK